MLTLEVSLNDDNEIVINHPDLKPDADGVGHIVFSVQQARGLAELLRSKAFEAERNLRLKFLADLHAAADAALKDQVGS